MPDQPLGGNETPTYAFIYIKGDSFGEIFTHTLFEQ